MKRQHIIYLLLIAACISLYSCTVERLKNQVKGVWTVEELKLDNRHVPWTEIQISGIKFLTHDSCKLPIRNYHSKDSNNIAHWDIVRKNGANVLIIQGASDSIFNGVYTVAFSQIGPDNAQGVKVMELTSPHIFMRCTF